MSWLIIGVNILVLFLTGCGGYGKSGGAQGNSPGSTESSTTKQGLADGQAGSGEKSFNFILSAHAPENDLSSQVIKYWGDKVTQKTNGRIKFQYNWAGSLVTTQQAFDALKQGTVNIADVAVSYIAGKVPAVSILQVPYAYPLMSSHVHEFYSQTNPILDKIYQQHSQKLIFTVSGQLPVAIISNKRFYTDLDAFHGALIRTAGVWQAKTMENWGAKPVVLDLGSLYTALQRGTVDSTLLDLELIKSYKIYEVAKYLTPLESSINYNTLNINLNQWNKLSPEDQKIMLDAGVEAQKYGREIAQKEWSTVLKELEDKGVQVKTLDDSVIDALRKNVEEKVWPDVQKTAGSDGDEIMKIVKQFQKYVLEKK